MELPRAAPEGAELGTMSPEVRRRPIIGRDPALRVGRVDRDRQRLEYGLTVKHPIMLPYRAPTLRVPIGSLAIPKFSTLLCAELRQSRMRYSDYGGLSG